MAKQSIEILPGWTLTFEEISNNVFKLLATDKLGRQAGTTDTDLERGIETCKEYVFNIEKQFNKDFSEFLFDFFLLAFDGIIIANTQRHLVYATWVITASNKSLAFEGRDGILVCRLLSEFGNWEVSSLFELSRLKFNDVNELINEFI